MGNFECSLNKIQTLMNYSLKITYNKKGQISINLLLAKFDLLNFKNKMILNVLKVLKRKVDRTRKMFEKSDYEWQEYSDGNIKIIRYVNRIENVKENPPDMKFEYINKISNGTIPIRKIWSIERALTRKIKGYSICTFSAKKTRVKNSFFVKGIEYWNLLPMTLRNKFHDGDKFKEEVITLMKVGLFD